MSSEEFKLLWPVLQDMQSHISTLNNEMGRVQAELAMIKWFLALVIGTSIASMISAIWSLLLHKSNGNNTK